MNTSIYCFKLCAEYNSGNAPWPEFNFFWINHCTEKSTTILLDDARLKAFKLNPDKNSQPIENYLHLLEQAFFAQKKVVAKSQPKFVWNIYNQPIFSNNNDNSKIITLEHNNVVIEYILASVAHFFCLCQEYHKSDYKESKIKDSILKIREKLKRIVNSNFFLQSKNNRVEEVKEIQENFLLVILKCVELEELKKNATHFDFEKIKQILNYIKLLASDMNKDQINYRFSESEINHLMISWTLYVCGKSLQAQKDLMINIVKPYLNFIHEQVDFDEIKCLTCKKNLQLVEMCQQKHK